MRAKSARGFPGEIVLKSRPKVVWILLGLGLAGITYGFYLGMQERPQNAIGFDNWEFGVLGAIACIAAITSRYQRVVVSGEYITKYWGTRIRRRFSIWDITEIRPSIQGISILVFAGGRKIYISPVWQGEAQVIRLFRTILEARTGNMSNAGDWLPLAYLTFPRRCVSCGVSDVAMQSIHAGWVISMGHAHLDRRAMIHIPVCRTCKMRQRKGLIWYWVLMIAVGAGVMAPGLAYLDFSLVIVQLVFVVAIVTNVGVNFLPRWACGRYLGISASKLKSDRTGVRLWFRDQQYEIEVRQLTEDCRSKSLAAVHTFQ